LMFAPRCRAALISRRARKRPIRSSPVFSFRHQLGEQTLGELPAAKLNQICTVSYPIGRDDLTRGR